MKQMIFFLLVLDKLEHNGTFLRNAASDVNDCAKVLFFAKIPMINFLNFAKQH